MIFNIGDHIELIKKGLKTQTRRKSDGYKIRETYSIQPCRTCKGILEGRILITKKIKELRYINLISEENALAEGGYKPEDFEKLYRKIYPLWDKRYAYTFIFKKRC